MSKEEIKRHFAEICECIWDRIESQDKQDEKAAFAMCKIVAQLVMLAWNTSIKHKSYAEFKKSLAQSAEQICGGNSRAMQSLMDAAELKWHDYRDDREPIVSVDVKQIEGKPHAVAYFKDERPDIAANGFLAFLQFMQSPENQERLKNTPPEKREEEMSRIADEYKAMHPEADVSDDDDDDDSEFEGMFEYPMSYEELEDLYEHTLGGVEKEYKLEILKELLKFQPFLAPLCKDAEACFEKSEKIYEKEQKTGKVAKYPGSVPELILTLLTAFTGDTDLEPYDEDRYKEYLRAGKKLVKALSEDEFDSAIRFEPEQAMLHFIVDRIGEFGLPEKEYKKQLGILLAWGLLLGDTREAQHDGEDSDAEEEYDFDENDLHALQLHVELRGYRCSADVLVREDCTFEDLHDFLNPLFNREDDHLYRFECEDGCTAVRDEEDIDDDEVLSNECYVGHHLSPGSGAYYLFDYGDEWEHDITVKKVTALDPKVKYPKVLKITGKIPEQYPDYDEEEEDEE